MLSPNSYRKSGENWDWDLDHQFRLEIPVIECAVLSQILDRIPNAAARSVTLWENVVRITDTRYVIC